MSITDTENLTSVDAQNKAAQRKLAVQQAIQILGMLPVLLLLCVAFHFLSDYRFFGLQNISIVMQQASINTVLAAGMTIVILTGGIDLSVGSILAVSAMAAVIVSKIPNWGLLGIPAALLCGLLFGSINGALIAFLRLPPFIVTLGSLTAVRGVARLMGGDTTVFNPQLPFAFIGNGNLFGVPVDKLGGKGEVIIENGPQVSAVIDRVNGCKAVFAKAPGVKVLSDDQDAKGSREGGLNVTQGYLTRFPKIDAMFTINDPQAIGTDLAAKQLNRTGIVISSVDGAPDIEGALKSDTMIDASASQDPYAMAQQAVEVGYGIMNGKKPENPMVLMPSTLVTRDNVKDYKGWSSPR
jgi:Periplasmic binding protein domain/Branched-chain amino acid transport system / permease component